MKANLKLFSVLMLTMLLSVAVSDGVSQTNPSTRKAKRATTDAAALRQKEDYIDAWYRPANVRRLWRNEVFFISLYSAPADDIRITEAGVMTNIFDDPGRDFAAAVNLKINGDRISFRTKSVGRISFQFAGVFFKRRKMGTTGERILRGTLRRFVGGKPAGRYRGDFIFIEPQCMR